MDYMEIICLLYVLLEVKEIRVHRVLLVAVVPEQILTIRISVIIEQKKVRILKMCKSLMVIIIMTGQTIRKELVMIKKPAYSMITNGCVLE
nr:MAG TPA: hypothetical protein [Bacteriophage sp.]DAV23951.1 MAG TPA: hypothetical protein [Bacteriophage sp.]